MMMDYITFHPSSPNIPANTFCGDSSTVLLAGAILKQITRDQICIVVKAGDVHIFHCRMCTMSIDATILTTWNELGSVHSRHYINMCRQKNIWTSIIIIGRKKHATAIAHRLDLTPQPVRA